MFDEQLDGDPHGECAAEIHKLQTEIAAEREKVRVLRDAAEAGLAVLRANGDNFGKLAQLKLYAALTTKGTI